MSKENIKNKENKKDDPVSNKTKKVVLITVILTIIVSIILTFIILTTRKILIISKLKNLAEDYTEINNIHAKIYNYSWHLTTDEIFIKDDKILKIHNIHTDNSSTEMILYKDADSTNIYIDNGEEKIAKLDTNENVEFEILNYFANENMSDFLMLSIFSDITEEYCNGKECYKITNLPQFLDLKSNDETVYIEKDSGLIVRIIKDNNPDSNINIDYITDFFYEFDTVTDNEIAEPDIERYEVQNNIDK